LALALTPGLAQNTVGSLRFVAHVVAILTLAACGSSSAAARQTPSPSHAAASPSASASASPPEASPSPQPSPTPFVGYYAVLATPTNTDTYTVSLVGIDGSVVASATPSSPTAVTCGDAAGALVPVPVSTSDTRAYFLDAQGNVRFLTPNGETGIATRVPTAGNVRSMFAVSPDDQRIAVVKATFTASGATTVVYVENLNGGGNHVQIFSETGAFTLWPTGWIGTSSLVVAKVPSCTQGGGPTCCGPQEYHVVNPSNGGRVYTVGGSACVPVGGPSPAGTMCEDSSFGKANILDWSGAARKSLSIQGPTPAYLSPDGSEVALVVDNQTTFAGAKETLDLVACGWIDGSHVIAGGDAQSQPRVGNVTTGDIAPVAAQGACAGRIPGGL
jgi:hypothetical protein